jgi:hypothetical protein
VRFPANATRLAVLLKTNGCACGKTFCWAGGCMCGVASAGTLTVMLPPCTHDRRLSRSRVMEQSKTFGLCHWQAGPHPKRGGGRTSRMGSGLDH